MTPLLQPEARWRPPRLKLAHTTPAVLRFQSGRRVRGKLQVVSVTGGLLCLPSPLDQGTRAKLMFLMQNGTVLGTAEMLLPVSSTLQPFRFVDIGKEDQSRLQDAIRSSAAQERHEQQSIIRERAW
jgi:hypothetical protein